MAERNVLVQSGGLHKAKKILLTWENTKAEYACNQFMQRLLRLCSERITSSSVRLVARLRMMDGPSETAEPDGGATSVDGSVPDGVSESCAGAAGGGAGGAVVVLSALAAGSSVSSAGTVASSLLSAITPPDGSGSTWAAE